MLGLGSAGRAEEKGRDGWIGEGLVSILYEEGCILARWIKMDGQDHLQS